MKAESTADASPLLQAITTTLRALEDRARYFRNLIIAVVTTGGVSGLFALMMRRWLGLAGFIILIPMVGGYLVLDSRRVRRWRSDVLSRWNSDSNDYLLYKKALLGFPHLPARSLRSMLAMLPEAINAEEEKNRHDFENTFRSDERKILIATCLSTSALLALTGAAAYRSVFLVACAMVLALATAISKAK